MILQKAITLFVLLAMFASRGVWSMDLKVAWLAPKDSFNNVKAASSMGGLFLAFDRIISSGSFTNVTNFDLRWRDSNCESKDAIVAMYDLFKTEVYHPDVIIGPPCSAAMKPIGELAGYRDLPIFGWVSDNPSFQDKSVYNSLVRILGPINAIGRTLLHMLSYFDWDLVFLISSDGEPYAELGSGVNEAIKDDNMAFNMTVTRWEQDVEQDPTVDRIKDIYAKIKKEARIVIMAVPQSELRRWMICLYDEGMANGDYVIIFLNPHLPSDQLYTELTSQLIWKQGDQDDSKAKDSFKNVLMYSIKPENEAMTNQFYQDSYAAAVNDAPNWPATAGLTPAKSDIYSPFLHDSVLLYVSLVQQALDSGLNFTEGSVLLDLAKNRHFSGNDWATGDIVLDENGDREPTLWLLDLNDDGKFTVAAQIDHTFVGDVLHRSVQSIRDVIWGDGTVGVDNAPLATPECGFQNEKCPDLIPYIVPVVLLVIIIIAVVAAVLINRRFQFEQSLKDMAWKIDYNDMKISKKPGEFGSTFQSMASNLRLSRASHRSATGTTTLVPPGVSGQVSRSRTLLEPGDGSSNASSEPGLHQVFIKQAMYKGSVVAYKEVRKDTLKIDRTLLMELTNMINIKHNNLANFIGATTDPGHIVEVWEYCSKGSLQDVLLNDSLTLDEMFQFSFCMDILKGLKYLQNTPLKVHGKLRSSNCVVESRWVCKLTDYGLENFHAGQEEDPDMSDEKKYYLLYWTAPELLPEEGDELVPTGATQAGDIYAVAVIVKEIFSRTDPYPDEQYDEVIANLRKEAAPGVKLYRPDLSDLKNKVSNSLLTSIENAWAQDPAARPSASHLMKEIQAVNPNKSTNVMDNMVKMMENYSNNLQQMVDDRTAEVIEEKAKSERLVYRLIPESVAKELTLGNPVQAESYESVTIYFSDIVSFTNLAAQSTAIQVVSLLSSLYTIFDSAIDKCDVYKVETIGDAYMLVSGLPVRNGDRHAPEVLNAAMSLLCGVESFKVEHLPDYKLRIRIDRYERVVINNSKSNWVKLKAGLHTGPVVTGVVGDAMPRYCLFGNTVNIATSMESGGMPMRIHISEKTYSLLIKYPGYYLAERGSMEVKGYGKMKTYWLVKKEGYDGAYPNFDDLAVEDDPPPIKLPITTGSNDDAVTNTQPTTNQTDRKPDGFRHSIESGYYDMSEALSSRKPSMQDDPGKLENIEEGKQSITSNPTHGSKQSVNTLEQTRQQERPSTAAGVSIRTRKDAMVNMNPQLTRETTEMADLTELPKPLKHRKPQAAWETTADETEGGMTDQKDNIENEVDAKDAGKSKKKHRRKKHKKHHRDSEERGIDAVLNNDGQEPERYREDDSEFEDKKKKREAKKRRKEERQRRIQDSFLEGPVPEKGAVGDSPDK